MSKQAISASEPAIENADLSRRGSSHPHPPDTMVSGTAAVAAFAAVVAVGSAAVAKPGSFDYYYPKASQNSLSVAERYSSKKEAKLCYEEGERAIGAKGYPAVPYLACCSGKPPLPMDPTAKSYVAKENYGLYCGGTGEVVPTEGKCYKAGERSVGAPGKPMVDYMPCCDGKAPQEKYGAWGKFCGLPSPYAPEPVVPKERVPKKCAGDDGYPYVPYLDCGDGYKCEREPKYGWGFFCMPTGNSCYGPGMKAQGAPGYPKIDYMPCCDGQKSASKYGEWGKFCPGKMKPMYEAPRPDFYKPYGAPDDYKPPAAPKGYEPYSYAATVAPTVSPTSYGAYPKSYSKAPRSSAAPAAFTALFGADFGCAASGNTAMVSLTTLPATVVFTTTLDITLPVCPYGRGLGLSQAQAEAILENLCNLAKTFDADAECIIEIVPAPMRMLELEDDVSAVVRQAASFRIVIGWSTAGANSAGFIASVSIIFGDSIVATDVPATTTAPPTTTAAIGSSTAGSSTMISTAPVPVPALAAVLEAEDLCSATGNTAEASGAPTGTGLSTTEIAIDLPTCEGTGGLDQEAADAVLITICNLAQERAPGATCSIESVPVRMLVLNDEDALSPVDRQTSIFVIVIQWPVSTPPASFTADIQVTFGSVGINVQVTVTAVSTDES